MSWSQGGTHLRNELMNTSLIAVLVSLVCTVLIVNNQEQEKTVNSFKKMNGQTVHYFTLGHPAMITDPCTFSNGEGAHIPKVPSRCMSCLHIFRSSIGFVSVSVITLTPELWYVRNYELNPDWNGTVINSWQFYNILYTLLFTLWTHEPFTYNWHCMVLHLCGYIQNSHCRR